MSVDGIVAASPVRADGQVGQRAPDAHARGRPRRGEQVKDGPLTLAVLVGRQDGRWSAELNGQGASCRALASMVSERATGALREGVPDGAVWGLAIVRKWRYVLSEASTQDMLALMRATSDTHRRRQGQRFLEHEIVAAAAMANGTPMAGCHVGIPALQAGDRLLEQLRASAVSMRVTRGPSRGRPLSVPALLSHWHGALPFSLASPVSWQAATPLAVAMAEGRWDGDVSVHFRRSGFRELTHAPTWPPAGMLRYFQSMDVPDGYPAPPASAVSPDIPDALVEDPPILRPPRGFCKRRYTGEHLVACVSTASEVRSRRKVRQAVIRVMQFMYPRTWRERVGTREAKGRKMVSRQTLDRAVVRTDIASMLARREWYRQCAGVYRHISFDASPQHGQEFFATVERSMLRSEVARIGPELLRPAVETRILPLVTLGKGRMGLAEKTQAYVHQTWLEYGPSAESVQSANDDVRVVLSDMGVELGIGEVRDVVRQCLPIEDSDQCGQSGQSTFEEATRELFPKAMVVPGPQHIIDGVLSAGVETLSWWAEWQASAKVLCQWLNPVTNRRWLKSKVRLVGGPQRAERLASLDNGCDRFADWRWKTLANVTRRLLKLQNAYRAAMSKVSSASEVSTRSPRNAAIVVQLASDDAFWARVESLHRLLEPLYELSSWVRGCECHEQERKDGKEVDCDWQGCRAMGLVNRVAIAHEELEEVRTQCLEDGLHEESVAVTSMLGGSREKFRFLSEDPYTLWQATDRAVARGILERRDSSVSEGGTSHRVIEYFVGTQEGSLREDFVTFVETGTASDRLRCELMSYSLARIDDTWAEAVHRQVTMWAKRQSRAQVPCLGASLRMHQSLASVASMTSEQKAFFHRAVEQWRSIGQKVGARAQRLVEPRKCCGASVVSMVYRYDDAASRSWTKELGGEKLSLLPPSAVRSRDAVLKLQLDYVERCVPEHTALSLPLAGGGGGLWYFLISEKYPLRKKLLPSLELQRLQGMEFPVALQRLQRVLAKDEESQPGQCGQVGQLEASGRVEVEYVGVPSIVDFLDLVEWSVLRQGLVRYSMSATRSGRLALMASGPVRPVFDRWDDSTMPTLVLLDELTAAGWRSGKPPATHAPGGQQVLSVPDPVKMHAYLQCLAGLSVLCPEPGCTGLPRGQKCDVLPGGCAEWLAGWCAAGCQVFGVPRDVERERSVRPVASLGGRS